MKEAASEANLTVVAIILIGVVVAIATPIITTMMKETSIKTSCMNDGYCGAKGGQCISDCGSTE